jgi:hypothetical protein
LLTKELSLKPATCELQPAAIKTNINEANARANERALKSIRITRRVAPRSSIVAGGRGAYRRRRNDTSPMENQSPSLATHLYRSLKKVKF